MSVILNQKSLSSDVPVIGIDTAGRNFPIYEDDRWCWRSPKEWREKPVRLIDLEPRWLSPDVFMFKNPTGGECWLTCKRIAMSHEEQAKLVWEDHPDLRGISIVLTKPDMAWKFNGDDFNTMTVFPSIDHSPSGNWHGFITDGEIR